MQAGVVGTESGAPAGQVEETPGRASLEKLGCRTPPQLHAGGVGRQQQQQFMNIMEMYENFEQDQLKQETEEKLGLLEWRHNMCLRIGT